MAERSEAVRQIVKKIRDDAEQALTLLDHAEEKKCRGEVFEPSGG